MNKVFSGPEAEAELATTRKLAHAMWRRFARVDADIELVRDGENTVFSVSAHDGTRYALRMHRPEYRSLADLTAEIEFIEFLSDAGIRVNEVIHGLNGDAIQSVPRQMNGREVMQYASMVRWVSGGQFDKKHHWKDGLRKIGEVLGALHVAAQGYQFPAHSQRPRWDVSGLVGENAIQGNFRALQLPTEITGLFRVAADRVAELLIPSESDSTEFGVIHGDPLDSNFLDQDGECVLIDFDDSGTGFYAHEVGTIVYGGRYVMENPERLYPLLEGYYAVRRADYNYSTLKPHWCARALLLAGWLEGKDDTSNWVKRLILINAVRVSHALLENVDYQEAKDDQRVTKLEGILREIYPREAG